MGRNKTREEVGDRLREFATRFGGPTALAREIDISPQAITEYLSGRRVPGNKMQARLRELGCDTAWLITGQTTDDINREYETWKRRTLLRGEVTDAEWDLLFILRRMGIKSREDFKHFFDSEKVGERVINIKTRTVKKKF